MLLGKKNQVLPARFAPKESGSHVQLNVGVATVESLTKLLTLARSQKGLALHLSAHAYRNDKAGTR